MVRDSSALIMVISTGDNLRTASSKEKGHIGGLMDRSMRVASREGCCTEEASGAPKIMIATRDNTGKTRNTGRVSINGVME
jgi:hypothetical protein